ncbi:rhomboid family intramembrane serine protease [Aureispira]|nr:rhomboid family intramembrane serine protease [Aureispira sp.]
MPANILDDIKLRYKQGNAIIKLIMVNVAVHLSLALFYVPVFLILGHDKLTNFHTEPDHYWAFIENWFYFPSELSEIPLRFWTIFSYMFLHHDFWHILMNMLVLYWFGSKLNALLPNKKIFPIYIWGGIAGALAFTIGYNIFPAFSSGTGNLVGASASVMAIVLAAATLNPRGTIHLFLIGAVELQYVAILWVIYNLIILPGGNAGGALAHLGGAFMGWFFIYQYRKGNDLSKPVNNIINRFSKNKKTKKSKGKGKLQTQSTFKASMKVYRGSQKSDYYGNEYGRPFMQKCNCQTQNFLLLLN